MTPLGVMGSPGFNLRNMSMRAADSLMASLSLASVFFIVSLSPKRSSSCFSRSSPRALKRMVAGSTQSVRKDNTSSPPEDGKTVVPLCIWKSRPNRPPIRLPKLAIPKNKTIQNNGDHCGGLVKRRSSSSNRVVCNNQRMGSMIDRIPIISRIKSTVIAEKPIGSSREAPSTNMPRMKETPPCKSCLHSK